MWHGRVRVLTSFMSLPPFPSLARVPRHWHSSRLTSLRTARERHRYVCVSEMSIYCIYGLCHLRPPFHHHLLLLPMSPATRSRARVYVCVCVLLLLSHQAIARILQPATQPPLQPPWRSSTGAYDSFISSSPLPSPALIPQHLHSSAGMQSLGTPRQCCTPGAYVLTPPPAVSQSLSLPLDTTALSAHSAASGNTSHIGVRDIAELVRHLAESRYMTRQLQQRVHQMESSMKTAATGDASISGTSTQEETAASAQVAGKRLATGGEAGIITVAEQATPLHSLNPQMATSERRQRTANLRTGG
ncbi:hypothetical protein, conserved [Leishmania tarentolae]|uniref:Uncharacterized protein n=1 Tax=Leishmania tarentolae TaxID=5689 RepID=A0A640KDP8_LEITA|nr:hypothetical protein, conserved [Leishmania tarentolae]